MLNNAIYEEFWFSNIYISLEKYLTIFQNSLIKSLIYKIKRHKSFQNFLTNIDGWNRKENVKNTKQNKKQIVHCVIFKKKLFHISIFFKRTSRIFQNLIGEREKKMLKK